MPFLSPLPPGEGQAAQQRGVRVTGLITLTLPPLRGSLPLPLGEGIMVYFTALASGPVQVQPVIFHAVSTFISVKVICETSAIFTPFWVKL